MAYIYTHTHILLLDKEKLLSNQYSLLKSNYSLITEGKKKSYLKLQQCLPIFTGINYQNTNEHRFSVGYEHHRRQNSATCLLARQPWEDLKFETVQGRGV